MTKSPTKKLLSKSSQFASFDKPNIGVEKAVPDEVRAAAAQIAAILASGVLSTSKNELNIKDVMTVYSSIYGALKGGAG